MQEHRINDRTKAITKMLEEREKLIDQNGGLKKTNEELRKTIEILREGKSEDFSTEICKFLDYDRKGKTFCRNKKAPIDTSDLTAKACMICSAYQPLKTKMQSTSIEEKQEIDSFMQKKKEETHRLQQSINTTMEKQKTEKKHYKQYGNFIHPSDY